MAKEIAIKELNSSNTLSGAGAREFLKRGKETFKVAFDKIRIRKGWNVRTDYGDIEGLAKSILENGLEKPIKGDLMDDGTFIPTDGHRRHAAIEILIKRGHDFKEVEVILNSTKMTDEQRLIQIWTSNDSKELTPLEKAEACKRLVNLGYKPLGIAEKLGVSRMQVDNYLSLAGLSVEEKEAVADGTIKPTAAVKLAKAVKDTTKRKEIIKAAKNKGTRIKEKSISRGNKNVKDISTAGELAGECEQLVKKIEKTADEKQKVLLFQLTTKLRDIKKIVK